MTTFSFPIRVDIATGERLDPTGLDPRALPWVQGAAQTLDGRTRRKYAEQGADLREKLAVLKSKRPAKTEADVDSTWGPALRPGYRSLEGHPLSTSKDISDVNADNQ